jgi:predicted nuclease of restriction endonuclease-like (RecB) superfamily
MTQPLIDPALAKSFAEVVEIIRKAKQAATKAVNTELVEMYWQIGAYISQKIAEAEWGDGVVVQLANHLKQEQPNLRGLTRSSLFRMRKFYETYRDEAKVAPLVRLLPWTHNLIILNQSKRPEEREFYLRMAIGILLCASQDDEVVEYALNRSLSPALIAEYQTQLPDKALWLAKLQEFYALSGLAGEG